MSVPRGLTAEEAAAWARLAQSVTPIGDKKSPPLIDAALKNAGTKSHSSLVEAGKPKAPVKQPRRAPVGSPAKAVAPSRSAPGLDSHWERKFKGGTMQPDFTLDLHDHSLDAAYHRLMHGLDQARAMQARMVLLITGKPRPVDPADRAERRGAIRAKVLDWIAASSHAGSIAAVRRAHQRHGGDGALYLVLKRKR